MAEQTPLLKEQGPPSAPPPQQPPSYDATGVPSGGMPPPPPSYAQQAPQQVIMPSQQVVVSQVQFSDVPVRLSCPNCQNDIVSRLEYEAGSLTWILVIILLLLGLWAGCCLIPLCLDGVKDVTHVCPVCSHHIGNYKRL